VFIDTGTQRYRMDGNTIIRSEGRKQIQGLRMNMDTEVSFIERTGIGIGVHVGISTFGGQYK
jgi:hypothetical protein